MTWRTTEESDGGGCKSGVGSGLRRPAGVDTFGRAAGTRWDQDLQYHPLQNLEFSALCYGGQ